MAKDSTSEIDSADRRETKGKRQSSIAWLLAVCAVIFLPLTMTTQAMLKIFEDDNVFTTPQIVYDILIFVGVIVSLPAMAIVTWMYLKRHPKLRRRWELWPLTASAIIIILSMIMFASANLFVPEVFAAEFLTILLCVVMGAFAVFTFSAVILMIHLEIVESKDRRYVSLNNERSAR